MIVKFYTLIDITKTNVTRNFKSQGSLLSQREWDFLRNKQRNWEVVIQLLGLRFQPMKISDPIKLINQNYNDYSFGNAFSEVKNLSIWKFYCNYDIETSIDFLISDFNDIPIISGLDETITLNNSCFTTINEKTNLLVKV